MNKKIIFFDWDGTLASKEISQLANIKRTEVLQEDVDVEKLVGLQHGNNNDHYFMIQNIIKTETGIENEQTIKRIQVYFFTFFYLKYFRQNPKKYLYFDIDEMNSFKKENNLRIIIVTSLFKEIINGVLNCIDPKREVFDGCYAIEDDLTGTKTEFIESAIKDFPEDTPIAMVGDRGEDIDAGKNNSLKTIFCGYGHGKVDYADKIVTKPQDLFKELKEFF